MEEVQALRAEVELLHQTLQDVTQVPPALPCAPTAATPSVPQFPLPWWCHSRVLTVPHRRCWPMTPGPRWSLPGSRAAASLPLRPRPRWGLCTEPCGAGTSSCR